MSSVNAWRGVSGGFEDVGAVERGGVRAGECAKEIGEKVLTVSSRVSVPCVTTTPV